MAANVCPVQPRLLTTPKYAIRCSNSTCSNLAIIGKDRQVINCVYRLSIALELAALMSQTAWGMCFREL